MAEFQIITDYNLNTPWILTDATLTNMAVGKLASLGSDQGLQLRAQTEVLQQQVADIESLRNLMLKFADANFVRFNLDLTTNLYKPTASWDISDLANSFPNRSLASASDATVQRLIDFYNNINQMYSDFGSTTRLEPNYFKFTFKETPTDTTTKTLIRTTKPVLDEQSGFYYYMDDNNLRHYIVLIKNEPFAVPINMDEYQNWLMAAAATRANTITQLFSQYKLSPISGDTITWQVVTASGNGTTFFGGTPVPTTNRLKETVKNRVVLDPDGKYYWIKQPAVGNTNAVAVEVKPLTPVDQALIFAPSTDTLRDVRSRFSEAALQITQRNSAQQLLVNSLLVSYNYHFDAAANVLKAFSDLRNRLAGNV